MNSEAEGTPLQVNLETHRIESFMKNTCQNNESGKFRHSHTHTTLTGPPATGVTTDKSREGGTGSGEEGDGEEGERGFREGSSCLGSKAAKAGRAPGTKV